MPVTETSVILESYREVRGLYDLLKGCQKSQADGHGDL